MRSPSEGCRTAGSAGLRDQLQIPSPFSGDYAETFPSPTDFRGEGVRTQFVFKCRVCQRHSTWPFYLILSLISGQRQLPAASAGDAFPAASQVLRGVRRAPWGRGCSRCRARRPTHRGSRRICTGPQLPLAASGCPPHGPLGCPPPPLPRLLPAPAPTPFHRKSHRQKPNGAAVPLL